MRPGISRTKLAAYVVEQLGSGRTEVVRELAAYLIEAKRTREAELLVREITEQFERRGIVAADVTSAEPIDEVLRTQIAELLGAKKLELSEKIDANVLGGIRVTTASRRFDATLARRLDLLRNANALNR